MSRIISAETPRESCQRWVAPSMTEEVPAGANEPDTLDKEALESLRMAAEEAGREAGYAAGLEAGREAMLAQAEQLSAIAAALAAPLDAVDDEVADQIARLALVVARHIVRREISLDSGVVVAAVQKAIACLPAASRDVRICLHPDDLAVVRDALSLDHETAQWRLVEDPLVERGGCRLETAVTEIDATIEQRLNALLSEMLGGARQGDQDEHDR